MTRPACVPDPPDKVLARQQRIAGALLEIESCRPAPPPPEPITDLEYVALRARLMTSIAAVQSTALITVKP